MSGFFWSNLISGSDGVASLRAAVSAQYCSRLSCELTIRAYGGSTFTIRTLGNRSHRLRFSSDTAFRDRYPGKSRLRSMRWRVSL